MFAKSCANSAAKIALFKSQSRLNANKGWNWRVSISGLKYGGKAGNKEYSDEI